MPSDSSPSLRLPQFLQREAEEQLPELLAAGERVLRSGRFLFGDELAGFEREFAAAVGSGEAVGVGSGTDALQLALAALDVGDGDEVITQSHGSPFTAIAIAQVRATPVFVESREDDFGLEPEAVRRALTPRTKAILPVHLYGHPVRIGEVLAIARSAAVPVIEDCAQAQGATVGGRQVGTFGTFGCFSFYPTKNVGALGDAGAVVTEDPRLAERVRRLRNGGMVAHGLHSERGITSRLDELQAAFLRHRLPRLPAGNERRRQIAALYQRTLRGVRLPAVRAGCLWAPHQYVIRHPQREALAAAMAARGWPLLVHYRRPIHLQDAFLSPRLPAGSLPVAERLAAEVLSLPTHPAMTDAEATTLVDQLHAALAGLEVTA